MEDDQEAYVNSLYDLAIIAEHDQSPDGNLICPRCLKEYHSIPSLEKDPPDEIPDHGAYECWQTHLELGFCGVDDEDPKEETPSSDGTTTS